MKRVFFIAGLFLCMATLQLSAQNVKVDDVINTYLKNTGGVKNWQSLKSIKMSGKMSMQGMDLPMVIYRMPENKQRLELSVQGKQIVQAFDGKDAWMVNPMMGSAEPQMIPEQMAADMKKEQFEDAFIDYKKKGHTAELSGKETIDGTEAYKIKFTHKNGDVKHYYFDTQKYMPIMMQSSVNVSPTQVVETETHMSNFKQVDGFVIPHQIEVRQNGQVAQKLTIESASFNEQLDASLFAFPGKQ